MSKIEDEIDKLGMVISAAEKWTSSYTKAPQSHAKILKVEAKMGRIMRKHFRGLAKERIGKYINWLEYHNQLIKAYDVKVIFDKKGFIDEEDSILFEAFYDVYLDGMDAGISGAQELSGHDIGMTSSNDAVLKAAREQTAQLVTQIDGTTRDRISQSIETSIRMGESTQEAAARLEGLVNDSYRAEMIARTEAVSSYTQGTLSFARESNAATKVWQALDPSDEECDIDGEEVGVDEEFSNGEDGPPVHPNCRCGIQLTYNVGDSGDNSDEVDSEE